jgi:hypothetical protein
MAYPTALAMDQVAIFGVVQPVRAAAGSAGATSIAITPATNMLVVGRPDPARALQRIASAPVGRPAAWPPHVYTPITIVNQPNSPKRVTGQRCRGFATQYRGLLVAGSDDCDDLDLDALLGQC